MIITYTNHLGASVSFGSDGVHYTGTDVMASSWTATDQNGSTVAMERGARDIEIDASMLGGGLADRDAFDDVFEADSAANVDGTLTVNGWRLRCRRTSSEPDRWWYDSGAWSEKIKLHSADAVWRKDESVTFIPRDQDATGIHTKGFPHGYPFGYPRETTTDAIVNLGASACPATVRFFGAASSPWCSIGGNRYEVDVSVPAGAYVEIDGIAKTAELVSESGDRTNVFSSLACGLVGSGQYPFAPVETGESAFSWPGASAVEVVMHHERSMPEWR